ncbi:hypothetical protein, partial [Mycobacterium tuberculosis]
MAREIPFDAHGQDVGGRRGRPRHVTAEARHRQRRGEEQRDDQDDAREDETTGLERGRSAARRRHGGHGAETHG